VIEPEDDPQFRSHCERVAEHFALASELGIAEQLYLRAGLARRAVEAYAAANAWQKAQELAQRELETTEARELLAGHAEALKAIADYHHAEILYAATEQYDEAINMYRQAGRRQDMIRLVSKFR
jgi:tetratricopeptide (TPR) repeat protein